MGISGVLFINQKAETIIARFYRDDVSKASVSAFRNQIVSAKKFESPVVMVDGCTWMFTRVGDVFLVAVSTRNCNPAMAFQFLYKLVDVCRAYFGDFTEENLRNNFVLIYELLDEVMDHGLPQITAVQLLTQYIKIADPTGKSEEDTLKPGEAAPGLTSRLTGAVDWREEGKFYKKNEIFIDVLESVNLLMSTKGGVLRSDVSGKIILKTYLSGMPECRFGLNDKVVMEREAKKNAARRRHATGIAIDDLTFHRSVKLGQFEHDRSINFVPPDGEFELMKYRVTQNVNLPFRLIPVVTEHGRSRVEYEIKVNGNFSPKLFANHVIITVPTATNVGSHKIDVTGGKAKYVAGENAISWKIKKFAGDGSYTLKAETTLLHRADDKQWSKPPISMEFQVPMFTSSGLHVRFMKIFERSNYDTTKWVRYMTKAGAYQIRM